MALLPVAIAPHALAPLSFLFGLGLFGGMMLANALWDAAASLFPARRRRAARYQLPDLEPAAPLLCMPCSRRVLPTPPWERRRGRMSSLVLRRLTGEPV